MGATVAYEAYLDGYLLLGTTEANLGSINVITSEIKGAGIAGSIDLPVFGLFQSMTLSLNWQSVTLDQCKLMEQKTHHLELWAAVQEVDRNTGQFKTIQHKHIFKVTPKNFTPGKLVSGETQDRSSEFEILYYKEQCDSKTLMEIDKLNFICNINGKDTLKNVRKAIGRE